MANDGMIEREFDNPFNVTQAKDFKDEEILDYWVDMQDGDKKSAFEQLIKPSSPMSMFIMGSKGSGKTHLMRYFSFSSQALRHRDNLLSGIAKDGYLGVYLRLGGLNANRFQGKGQDEDVWKWLYAYYLELWLAQALIACVCTILNTDVASEKHQQSICTGISDLLTDSSAPTFNSLVEVGDYLKLLSKELDSAVNNCSLTGRIDLTVKAKPSNLIFGIPLLVSKNIVLLNRCRFVYLLDEFENIGQRQQMYINTLIKEADAPVAFKIGARLYGRKTNVTFSGDDELVKDAEYEEIWLDRILREEEERYEAFAKKLIIRRLRVHGYVSSNTEALEDPSKVLSDLFEGYGKGAVAESICKVTLQLSPSDTSPTLKRLKNRLNLGLQKGTSLGVREVDDIDVVLTKISCPDHPVHERFNAFMLYRDWFDGKNLLESASRISEECRQHLDGIRETTYADAYGQFSGDMLAQVLRDSNRGQVYGGLEQLIKISWGVPRNLLKLLKSGFDRARFRGEEPFEKEALSLASQEEGVLDAAEWFFQDAKIKGHDSRLVRDSINRLGTFFRRIRFSDKPVECSLVSFSTDLSQATEESQRILELAVDYSLLIDAGTRRDKNTGRIDSKYQLNRMLSPRWDLPIHRRGILPIVGIEFNMIFDHQFMATRGGFERYLKQRVSSMMAPNFGKTIEGGSDNPQSDMFSEGLP